MAVYLLGAIDRKDLETYAKYEAEGFKSFTNFAAEIEPLAVCDSPQTIEGTCPAQRFVLLKFKDRATLDRWYKSPEYQKALPLRLKASDTKFIVAFEGLS